MLKRFALAAFALLLATPAGAISKYANFGRGVSDSSLVIATPVTPLPAVGDSFYDASLGGVKVKRIRLGKHHYQKDQPWSRRGTKFINNAGDILDGNTYALITTKPSNLKYEHRWAWQTNRTAAVNDTIMYTMRGGSSPANVLYEVGVPSNIVLRTLTLPIMTSKAFHGEGNPDKRGRFLVISNAGTDSIGTTPGRRDSVCVVDLFNWRVGAGFAVPLPAATYGGCAWTCAGGNQVGSRRDIIGHVDTGADTLATGRYRGVAVIKYEGLGDAMRVFEFNTHPDTLSCNFWRTMTASSAHRSTWPGTTTDINVADPGGWIIGLSHADGTTDPATGDPILVGSPRTTTAGSGVRESGTGADVAKVNLRTGEMAYVVPNQVGFEHASTRNLDREGWAYITTINSEGSFADDSEAGTRPDSTGGVVSQSMDSVERDILAAGQYDNEIFAVALDGSRRIQRLTHYFSTGKPYDNEAHGVAHWDGRRVVFSSNWNRAGQPSPSATYDTYVADARPETLTVTNDATLTAANASARYGDVINLGSATYTVAPLPSRRHSNVTVPYSITYIGNVSTPSNVVAPGVTASGVSFPSYVSWKGFSFTGGMQVAANGFNSGPVVFDSLVSCNIVGNTGWTSAQDCVIRSCTIGDFLTDGKFIVNPGTGVLYGAAGRNKLENSVLRLRGPATSTGGLWHWVTDDGTRPIRNHTMTGNTIAATIYGDDCSGTADARLGGAIWQGVRSLTATQNKFSIYDSTASGDCGDDRSIGWRWLSSDSSTFTRDTVVVSGYALNIDMSKGGLVGGTNSVANTYRACFFKNPTSTMLYFGQPGIWFSSGMRSTVVDSSELVAGSGAGAVTVTGASGVNELTQSNVMGKTNATAALQLDCSGGQCTGATLRVRNSIMYTGNTAGGTSAALAYVNETPLQTTFDCDYNLYSNYVGSANSIRVGSVYSAPGSSGYHCVSNARDCNSYYGSPLWTDSTTAAYNGAIGSASSAAIARAAGGGDIGPKVYAGDATRPDEIADLVVSSEAHGMRLSWTATGDDSLTGTAAAYDMRYSTAGAITSGNWSSASAVGGTLPTPLVRGTVQDFLFQEAFLSSGTQYWIAMKARDEAGNWSGLSNVVTQTWSSSGGGSGGPLEFPE